ncbi:MAG: SAM-dependent methyltransferase [Sphingomicrobium sp.]
MTQELFDRNLRSLRRDRAARAGADKFLHDRAFDDCLDRLRGISRTYDRALLVGCPSPSWPGRLGTFAQLVDVVDPGKLFARQAGGNQVEEDRHDFGEDRYDLCIAIGTLDTVNDLPVALQLIRRSLRHDAPIMGAMAGGNSLATLRACLVEAGRKDGRVAARTHPRIEAPSLAQLLSATGYSMPVVDIDRVKIRYGSLDDLVRDLRAMGATSVLAQPGPVFSKSGAELVREAFAALAQDGRTEEIVEILHFLGWNQ